MCGCLVSNSQGIASSANNQSDVATTAVEIGFLAAASTAVADKGLAGRLSAAAAALSVMGVSAREDDLVTDSMVAAAVPLVVTLFPAVVTADPVGEATTACDTLPMGTSA